jgi:hypothetical protein
VNSGKTPAKDLFTRVNLAVHKPGDPIVMLDFSKPRFHAGGLRSRGLLHPDVPFDLNSTFYDDNDKDLPLVEDVVKSINEGRLMLCARGRITYKDVFGRPHWLNFCYVALTPNAYSACEQGNDSDD